MFSKIGLLYMMCYETRCRLICILHAIYKQSHCYYIVGKRLLKAFYRRLLKLHLFIFYQKYSKNSTIVIIINRDKIVDCQYC